MTARHDWLTPREAAFVLRVTTGTIYAWVRRGLLPAVRSAGGGRLLIARDDLALGVAAVRDPGPARRGASDA